MSRSRRDRVSLSLARRLQIAIDRATRAALGLLVAASAACGDLDAAPGAPDPMEDRAAAVPSDGGPALTWDGTDPHAIPLGSPQGSLFVDLGEGPQELTYHLVDGRAVHQGDMVLAELPRRKGAEAEPVGLEKSAIAHLLRWPGGRIPYEIDDAYGDDQAIMEARIGLAIAHWNASAPVRLVRHDPSNRFEHFVQFTSGDGCSSDVGYRPDLSPQHVHLDVGCGETAVRHEIGHTVGLFHEQSRLDRSGYVGVNWANIDPVEWHNFSKYLPAQGLDWGAYDLRSLMQYSSYAFAIDANVSTITRADCALGSTDAACLISPDTGLTSGDKVGVTRQITGDPPVKFRLRNEATGRCLQPAARRVAAGAGIVEAVCADVPAQRWYTWRGDGLTTDLYVNEASRMCIAVDGRAGAVYQDPCLRATRFLLRRAGGGINRGFQLVSDRCAATNGTGTAVALGCVDEARQRWFRDFAPACGVALVTDARRCGSDRVRDGAACGLDTVMDSFFCGTELVRDALACGTRSVTDAFECGVDSVTDAIECGTERVTDGARCGWRYFATAVECAQRCASGGGCDCANLRQARACDVARTCDAARTCDVARTCEIALECPIARTCDVPRLCDVPRSCEVPRECVIRGR